MRLHTHIDGWAARLLAVLLAVALLAPAWTAHANPHAHTAAIGTAIEVPAGDAGDGHQNDACVICHGQCGCHVGIAVPTHAKGVRSASLESTIAPGSDQRRPSVPTTQLIRPPRA